MNFKIILWTAALLMFSSVLLAQDCIECHTKVTPKAVSDWKLSKHALSWAAMPTTHMAPMALIDGQKGWGEMKMSLSEIKELAVQMRKDHK